MTAQHALALALLASSFGACAPPRRAALGTECTRNSECDAPLVCRLGFCRNECATSADCAAGLSCVLTGAPGENHRFGACQLESETDCTLDSECPTGLVCRFRQCTNACNENRDCPGGARCELDPTARGNACIDRSSTPCTLDGDCVSGEFCLDGRCRAQCGADRDCRNDFWCDLGRTPSPCLPPPRPSADAGLDAGACLGGVPENTVAECSDGCSNDGDALVDCEDADCCGVVSCDGATFCGARDAGARDAGARIDAALDAPRPPSLCPGPALGRVQAVSTGRGHACALAYDVTDTLRVYCWGTLPGTSTPTTCAQRQSRFDVFTDVAEVDAGGTFTCVRMRSGAVYCDLFSAPADYEALALTAGTGTDMVAAGASHVCVIVDGSTVRCVGANESGQLGDGTTTPSTTPRLVTVLDTSFVDSISAGRSHTCLLLGTERDIECFGADGAGQLGNGTGGFPALIGMSSVDAGGEHTVALSGNVWGWGQNSSGQLSDPALGAWPDHLMLDAFLPMPLGILGQLHAGGAHTCLALDSDTWCWGSGIAVDGSPGTVATPTLVLPGITRFDTGDDFTCGITGAEEVVCVGSNATGALGDGTLVDRITPDFPVLL